VGRSGPVAEPVALDDGSLPEGTVRAQVRVLGPVEVIGPHGPAQLIGARQRAVAGLLALNPGAVLPRWRLVDALWGDQPPRTAVKSLHSHVARVRQALDACGLSGLLVTRDAGYALMLDPDDVDAARFEELAQRGHDALVDSAPARAAAHLVDGLALWRHEMALADADPVGWGAAEVARLSEVRLTASEDRWEAELRLGRHDAAVGELERLLVAHPLRERLVALLMLALYRSGRHAAALDAYLRLRSRLRSELGVDPGPELVGLHARILRREPDLARSVGEPAVGGPTRVEAGAAPMPRPAQLPARVGHFTGRGDELAALDRLVDHPDDDVRVAVISGSAGIGKTALAVQWAHRVADHFPDGQLFVDLRGHDPQAALSAADALSQLLRSLGVPADRIPAAVPEQAALYRSLLHGRRFLVVADNGGAADVVLPLVPAGPGNLIVVTSRAALTALATHHAVCAVGLDVLGDDDALALLRRLLGGPTVDAEPQAAADLVRLCDGMPLAVRIAAAKLAGRARREIRALRDELSNADRLDVLSVEGDSRSVRTVFASAYRALSPPAARVFRLLGLHPGPTFTAHLAAAVADLSPAAAEAAVDELAAAHLAIAAGSGRYRYHDLIRLFAHQCAVVDGGPADRDTAIANALDWYLSAAHAANRVLDPGRDRVTPTLHRPAGDPRPEPPFPPERHAALAFLDGERANLVPVVRFATEHGYDTAAWQLTYLLTSFYASSGHWGERAEMCRWAVRAARSDPDPAVEGLMLSGLGVSCTAQHRFEEALESLHRALPLMQAGGDRRGEGHVYNNIAAAYSGLRRFDEAVRAFRQALAVHTANDHRLGVALALNNTGHTYVRMGRPELSSESLLAALAISREIDHPWLEGMTLHSLGEAGLVRGDAGEAIIHFGQALAVYRRIGDRLRTAETLNGLGLARLAVGDPATALDHGREALALAREIADNHLEAATLGTIGRVLLDTGDVAGAAEQLGLALVLRARAPDAYEEAHLHRALGDLAERSGDPDAARRHRDEARRLYTKANATDEAERLAAHPSGARPAPAAVSGVTATAPAPHPRPGS
jgi:DNA-binding SARP family transcriptional activator/tetratricopeptide (TPR) repeat protein